VQRLECSFGKLKMGVEVIEEESNEGVGVIDV
jgi:hypothetical protein